MKIKLRAWHKKHEILSDVSKIDFNDFGGAGTIWNEYGDEWGLEWCKLLQYTGLKDPEGKDVYQDDIIMLYEESFEDEPKSYHRVVWGGEQYPAWTLRPGLECEMNVFSYLICSIEAEQWKVVGNIYENPELLDD